MRGTLTQWGGENSGKWRLRVFAGRDVDGKTVTVSRNFAGSRRQAQSALAKLVADVERDQTKSHKGTLGELLDAWLVDIEPHRSRYTMREHRRSVEKRIQPALGSMRLDRLNAKHLDEFYRALFDEGLSPASVRRHHSILSAALGRAVKWDWIATNPADKATPPGPTRSNAEAPVVDNVQRLIGAAKEHDDVLATAIALAATTGARRGELCALRWSDVDRDRRRLRIDKSLTMIDRTATVGPTKTHQRRDISIDATLLELLAARRGRQDEVARALGADLCEDAFILSRSPDGSEPCSPDSLTGGYARLAQRLGIGGYFHQLRHFAATTAVASGADVRTVSSRLGHADPSVTLKVYAHAVEARDRDVASLLGRTVLGSATDTGE